MSKFTERYDAAELAEQLRKAARTIPRLPWGMRELLLDAADALETSED